MDITKSHLNSGENADSEHLWVVHRQIKFDDYLDVEGPLVPYSRANHGMSIGGIYRTKASVDEAVKTSFYAYMEKTFGWNPQQVQENMNQYIPDLGEGSMYYWEGEVTRKIYQKKREVNATQYAVISFSAFHVTVTE